MGVPMSVLQYYSWLAVQDPRCVIALRDFAPWPEPHARPQYPDEIERTLQTNLARIDREHQERMADIDYKYAMVEQAFTAAGPDALYWGWLVGMVAIELLKALL